jgi:Flp pilus assembly protein TadD
VMTPVEAALNMADAETPPISPSIPASGMVSLHPPPGPPESAAAAVGSVRPAPIVPVVSAAARTPLRPAAAPAVPPRPAGVFQAARPLATTLPGFPAADMPVSAPSPDPPVAPVVASPALATAPELSTPAHERNPPAMTLPAPVVATAAEPARGPLPVASGWRAHFNALAAWFAALDAKLHGKRISPRTAAVLVGLGALQGLGIVTVWAGARWLLRPASTGVAAADHGAEAALKKPEPPPPAPAPSSAEPQQPPAPQRPPALEQRDADGSGRDAPDCDTLLQTEPPHEGHYPGAALKHLRAGRTAIVRGDLPGAQASLCRAARYNEKSAQIALELSLVLLLERDGADALLWARRAVELDPANLGARDALGDALARVGAASEARAAFMLGAGLAPNDQRGARALLTRAMKQADKALRRGDYLTAERGFRRASALEPKSSSAASGLSYALLQLGDTKAGVLWAERAVALAPRSSGARLALGDALAKAGEKQLAAKEWRESALLDPGNREAQKRLRVAGLPPT